MDISLANRSVLLGLNIPISGKPDAYEATSGHVRRINLRTDWGSHVFF